ncbi:MAG: TerC/Alx family metal homeostasis membrane protein [Bacteroidetes bacterium]|nr:TerC/Alx family metal homeostasis membrane protein [Bacteroidota bacterium]
MNETLLLVIFAVVVTIMLLLDLGLFNKKEHIVSTKEAGIWTIVWISISLLFSVFINFEYSSEKALEFLSAYLIEKSLSLDNIFVFVLIFSFYKIEDIHKHKVLFWGILGAIVFRAIFIFSGLWLIELTYLPEVVIFGMPVRFNILLTIFAVILIVAGIKSFKPDEKEEKDFGNNFVIRYIKKLFPVTDNCDSGRFIEKKNGIKYITPLLLTMVTIELSDVVFAVDSIPAIFAISKDPIILYTSNIFAILGLRSMFFLLSNIINYFSSLKQGIAVILIFIGIKMLIDDFYSISSLTSLIVIAGIIFISIILSLIKSNIQIEIKNK